MRTAGLYTQILRWNVEDKNLKFNFFFFNFHFLFLQHCPEGVLQYALATTFSGSF